MRGNKLARISRTARVANAREIEANSILRSTPDSSVVLAAAHECAPPRPVSPPPARSASLASSCAPAERFPSPSPSAIEPSLERFASNELEADDIVLGDDSDGTTDDGEVAHHAEDEEHDDGIDSDFEEPVGQVELEEPSSDADNLSDDEISYRQFLDITYSNDAQLHEPIDESPSHPVTLIHHPRPLHRLPLSRHPPSPLPRSISRSGNESLPLQRRRQMQRIIHPLRRPWQWRHH
jgi:hypothetical protein